MHHLLRGLIHGIAICAFAAWMSPPPALAAAAVDGEDTTRARPRLLEFDIAAQPLAAALQRYAVTADQTVLFSDALVSGRTSAAIKGRFPPRVALEALLAGTGLTADDSDPQLNGGFVLRRAPVNSVDGVARTSTLDRRYDGLVQMRVFEALCADPRTVPGDYRALLRLQLDREGQLFPHLVRSTGNVMRDAALLGALGGLRMEQAPPADLRQPLVMVILPRDRVAGTPCEAEGARD